MAHTEAPGCSLRALRFPVTESRGRRYPEPPHPFRNDFQRDRDRVIHARAFRRLENKTQVFTPSVSDHFRNRLTHTIEVSQIARTAARVLELDEDLTETLALVHDIGHPPFAHAGEAELDRRMQRFGARFDHNEHALRLVEKFEQRYARFPGLNLTFEVREGIVKHSRDIEPGEFPQFDQYLPGLRPPLEAQLIDVADEIAYNTADLDDAFSAGMFGIEEVREAVPMFAEIHQTVENQFPGAEPRELFLETLRAIINELVSGFLEGTRRAALAAGVASAADVREHRARLADLAPEAREASTALKTFLRNRVYLSPALREDRERSARRIGRLFELFLGDPARMPAAYLEETRRQPVHRVICDYIAGMTDRYFLRAYEQLLGSD